MALQILEQNGTFLLQGNLTTSTTKSFIFHFENLIRSMNEITLDINNVNSIDKDGVAALKRLMSCAIRSNKMFYVIGNGCKDIYEDFKISFAA